MGKSCSSLLRAESKRQSKFCRYWVCLSNIASKLGSVVAAARVLSLDDLHAQCFSGGKVQIPEKRQCPTLSTQALRPGINLGPVDRLAKPFVDCIAKAGERLLSHSE